ncbi:Uncharacterised protein [Klebsiella pneumoniae]|nr:Uncharacterised protein [Klebsiella pneumoniae]
MKPTESDEMAEMVSVVLNSKLSVSVIPTSTGIRVVLAIRIEPVVVRSAFSAASYTNAEPEPESAQKVASLSRLPFEIRLPRRREFSSVDN